MDEATSLYAVACQQCIDTCFRRRAGHQHHALVFGQRCETQGTQAVQIAFYRMSVGMRLRGIKMREAVRPETCNEPTGRVNARCYRPARAQQARQPCAALMHGKMDDQIVMACAQLREQAPFGRRLAQYALFFPVAVDDMELRQMRISGQHGHGIAVNQRVDFTLRRKPLQH